VRSATVLHDSHPSLWKWLVAVYLTVTARRGLTAHELHATLGGSYKSWWYAAHRLRWALDVRSPERELPSAVFEAIGAAVEPRREHGPRRAVRSYRSTGRKYGGYYSLEARWRAAAGENNGTCAELAFALVTGTPLHLDDLVRGTRADAQAA
jgi:hypothetical protein